MRARVFPACCIATVLVGGLVPGCGLARRKPDPAPIAQVEPAPVTRANSVEIDMSRIGAEQSGPLPVPDEPLGRATQLAFLATGFGVEPRSGNPVERKSSALEAAVIDAIGRAVRELQRDPKTDKRPVEYTFDVGPNLTVFGQLVSGAPRTVVLMDDRGRITELAARDGMLAHPPHDARVIQQIFAATEGRLVLNATGATDRPRRYRAEVGVYRAPTATSKPNVEPAERPVIDRGW